MSLISVLTIWRCSCVSPLLCCWKRVLAVTSAFSCRNSVSLCPPSLCASRPNLPVSPGISWFPTFAFQSCVLKRAFFFSVSSGRSCRSSQNHGFFSISDWGIDLDYWDIECFVLETDWDHLSFLKEHPSTAFRTLLLTMRATQFLLRDSCPQ